MSGTVMISFTPAAAAKVRALLESRGLASASGGLRVRVKSGGCAGLNLEFDIAGGPEGDDKVYETHGARILVDPKSEFFLFGSTVDFESSLMKSGFVIQNPNATSTCGCGTSFSV